MEYLLIGAFTAFGILTAITVHHYFLLKKSVAGLEQELAAVKKLSGHLAGTSSEITEPWIRMVVEVKNPIALAHRESNLAKMASGTAPHLVVKKVYEQVMAQTKEQLKSRDVDADVSLIIL